MEITRDYQLRYIAEGLKSLGITQHALEKQSGLEVGTIKDFKRGRTHIMRADKWQKICNVITPDAQPTVYVIAHFTAGNLLPIDGLPLVAYNRAGTQILEGMQAVIARVKKVSAPPGVSPRGLVAAEATDDALPGIWPGDFVFYDFIIESNLRQLVNKRCIVKLKGDPHPHLRVLRHDGASYIVSTLSGSIAFGVEIEWASAYRGSAPPE